MTDLMLGLICDCDFSDILRCPEDKVIKIRNRMDDKSFKDAPGLELTNEQHRKRESKRCGRMIR
jgi:hypothetical protein